MSEARTRLAAARLYLLATTALCRRPLIETVALALEGGVDVVQLREKEIGDRAFLRLARTVCEVARAADVVFLLNDRVAVAQITDCDGVHVGQDDLHAAMVRGLLPEGYLVGVSAHDPEQARAAEAEGADYIGVGPAFATSTKDTGYSFLGPDGAAEIARAVPIPAFAIGGIGTANVTDLVAAGIRRIAVSSAILGAADPVRAASDLAAALGRTDS